MSTLTIEERIRVSAPPARVSWTATSARVGTSVANVLGLSGDRRLGHRAKMARRLVRASRSILRRRIAGGERGISGAVDIVSAS